jgi:hypothetical protein
MVVPISSAMDAYSFRVAIGSRLSSWGLRPFFKGLTHRLFNEIFLTANGSFEVIESYTPEMAMSELRYIKKFLPKLRKLVANIEAGKFLHDKGLEEKIQSTLDKLYALEGELRVKAYAGKSLKPASREIIDSLNEKSKAAIGLILNRK